MSKIHTALQIMLNLAADNTHGYDQIYRWGEHGDYDCSSAIITACEQAGIPLKTAGATYTGNMKSAALKIGCFIDIIHSVNLATGEGLMPGDILLNEAHHVAMFAGNNQIVHASINEKGTATNGKPGDQTGHEFCVRSYYNKPWNVILRYTGGDAAIKVTDYKAVGVVRVNSYLNVRLTPSTAGTVVGGFNNGDTVYINGKCGNGWYRCTIWDGSNAYVCGDYVDITQVLTENNELTDPNDIVYELVSRGLVHDGDGLLADIRNNPNSRLYYLSKAAANFTRTLA